MGMETYTPLQRCGPNVLRQVLTILPGGRRSLSSPAAGAHCPPPSGRCSLSSPAAGVLSSPAAGVLSSSAAGVLSYPVAGVLFSPAAGFHCPPRRQVLTILPGGRSPSQRGGASVHPVGDRWERLSSTGEVGSDPPLSGGLEHLVACSSPMCSNLDLRETEIQDGAR